MTDNACCVVQALLRHNTGLFKFKRVSKNLNYCEIRYYNQEYDAIFPDVS